MKKRDTAVKSTDRLVDFVERLVGRELSILLKSEFVLHPLNLHETVTHAAEAAKLLNPAAASIAKNVAELLAPHAAAWDAELGPPARPTWLDAAIREAKASSVTDSDVVAASRRLGL